MTSQSIQYIVYVILFIQWFEVAVHLIYDSVVKLIKINSVKALNKDCANSWQFSLFAKLFRYSQTLQPRSPI
jgi:hypothetical protein